MRSPSSSSLLLPAADFSLLPVTSLPGREHDEAHGALWAGLWHNSGLHPLRDLNTIYILQLLLRLCVKVIKF